MKFGLVLTISFLATTAGAAPEKTCKGLLADPSATKPVTALKAPELVDLDKMFMIYTDKEKAAFGEHMLAALASNDVDEYARQVRQQFIYKFLKWRLISVSKTRSVLIGNSETEPPALMLAEIKRLGAKARAEGLLLIYDADAKTAPYIREAAGPWCLGLSGRSPKDVTDLENVFALENPILRLKIFQSAKDVTMSSDSTIGQAIALASPNKITWQWMDEEAKAPENYSEGLRRWVSKANAYGLGLAGYEKVPMVYSAKSTFETDVSKYPLIAPNFSLKGSSFDHWARNMMSVEINEILEPAKVMAESLRVIAESDVRSGNKSASVLGSSQEHADFVPLVTNFVRKLSEQKYTIFTGGSSGFMRLANAVAVEVGVESVGIPLKDAKRKLKKESTVATDVHTITLPATDYTVRIPLLIHRPVVAFVPGGKGTMKEFAALLVAMAAKSPSEQTQDVFFVSDEYYKGLFIYLQRSGLPKSLLDRMRMIDGPQGSSSETPKATKDNPEKKS